MDDAALRALDRGAYINLATFRKSGVPVETPVWFALRDGRLWVFTEAKSGKVKRLRNDPHIRVAPCNVRGSLRGDWIDGTAERVDDEAEVAGAYAALHAKYGWQMRLTDFLSRLSGRIDKRAVLALTLGPPLSP